MAQRATLHYTTAHLPPFPPSLQTAVSYLLNSVPLHLHRTPALSVKKNRIYTLFSKSVYCSCEVFGSLQNSTSFKKKSVFRLSELCTSLQKENAAHL